MKLPFKLFIQLKNLRHSPTLGDAKSLFFQYDKHKCLCKLGGHKIDYPNQECFKGKGGDANNFPRVINMSKDGQGQTRTYCHHSQN